MYIIRLIIKNMMRHRLRSLLTVFGISVAVMAFGLMRTVVTAWNSGIAASAVNRLITLHAVSFVFPLPLSYNDRIAQIPGVQKVSHATWFQGIYIDRNQFFARMAIDPETIWDIYPEYILSDSAKDELKRVRSGCVIGRKIAEQYKLKVGDLMTLEGDIYPGKWEMQVVGIYTGKDQTTDETQMFFNWKYLDEEIKRRQPGREGYVGWFIIKIDDPEKRTQIAAAVDNLFANSPAETKTQTEKEFQQSFVSMSGAIITAIDVVSFVIIAIILLVLTNTMVMTARERIREYAVLRTLGFKPFHIAGLIGGEAMFIAFLGGGLGLIITYPLIIGIEKSIPSGWFPVFKLENITIILAISSAVLAGITASAFPIVHAVRTKIVDGLRQIV
jgi:putative ABC transport system permease protein